MYHKGESRALASSHLVYNFFYTMKNVSKESDIRSKYIKVRVSQKEYDRICQLAKDCGKTVSDYGRCSMLGQQLRHRLTPEEIAALCSLSDARGDLVKLMNALHGRSAQERETYFKHPKFMRAWIAAVEQIIRRLREIEKRITL